MDKHALILIPGLVCDETVWVDQVEHLSARADIDSVAHGVLDSLPAMAENILATAPSRFALAGHSMGGRIALEMFRQAPERIAGLALLDTGYEKLADGDAGQREIAGRRALIETAQTEGMRAMGRAWVQGMVHPDRLDDGELIGRILDMIEARPVELFEAQIRALIDRPDATALLSTIGCPTLVLCGREDAWSPLDRHRAMAGLIRGSTLVAVPDCGHMSTMERPQAVSAALASWLDSLG